MRLAGLIPLIAVLVALAAEPCSARAATTVVPYTGVPFTPYPVALAGDDIVSATWREDPRGGHAPSRIRVLRRTPDGTTTTIATLPAPPRAARSYTVMLGASATTWALAIRWIHIPLDLEDEQPASLGDMVVSGPVSGGAPRSLARCRMHDVDAAEGEVWVGVAGDDVAWSNSACPGGEGVQLAHAGAVQHVGFGYDVKLTTSHLAFFTDDSQRKITQIEVIDRVSGVPKLVDADSVSGFALGDGLVAVTAKDDPACPGTDCDYSIMRVAADGTIERPGLAPVGNGGEPGGDPPPFVAGGGRVMAQRLLGNGVVAVDLATGARSFAGLLGLEDDEMQPLAVDATRAIYAAERCDGRRALHFEDTVPDAPSRLPFAPCPVRVLSHTAILHLPQGRARIKVRCPRGCDGSLDVVTHTDIGTLDVHAPAGAMRTATLELYRRVARRLRGGRTLAVTVLDDGEDRPGARPQAPIHLRLKLRGG